MFNWLRSIRPKPAVQEDSAELFDEQFQRRLEYLAIVSRRLFAGKTRAERRSKKTGSGIEFADHREYAPGDDFRYLDWNVYGRTNKLLLRLFEEEEDLSVYILLDCSRSMGFGHPSKLRYGKQIAAAMAYIGLANLDRVSLLSFADKIVDRLPPTRGKNRIFTVFQFLSSVEADGTTDLADAMKTFVAQHKRRGVAIVLSDFYDHTGLEQGLNVLRYAKFEPFVLHLVNPAEATPPMRGDLWIVDAETGERREVTITPRMVERYRLVYEEYLHAIEEFCTQKQIPYVPLDISVPYDQAVLRILRRSGMVV